jgi:hypothetical protein
VPTATRQGYFKDLKMEYKYGRGPSSIFTFIEPQAKKHHSSDGTICFESHPLPYLISHSHVSGLQICKEAV